MNHIILVLSVFRESISFVPDQRETRSIGRVHYVKLAHKFKLFLSKFNK